jgi:hypothetical protein
MSTQTTKEKDDEDQGTRVDHLQHDQPLATAPTDEAGSERWSRILRRFDLRNPVTLTLR